MKQIIIYITTAFVVLMLSGCEEKLGPSRIDTTPPERSAFDMWLLENYVDEYNIDFKYRLDDTEADLTYNLIPADVEKSKDLAKIIKYLWLEAYDELFDKTGTNKDFMRAKAPKVIQLVGSSAINPSTSTEVLGTAEAGIKVILYKVNSIDPTDIEMLNEYYFETMHHEFAHILHQAEDVPVEFLEITPAGYSSTGWNNRTPEQAWKLGFVTPYASKEPQEDFVETIAMYLVNSDEYWQYMLDNAGEYGAGKINEKFAMAEDWLLMTWDIDIHELRSIINRRSQDIESILNK